MGRWKIGRMGGWVNDRIQTDGERWADIYTEGLVHMNTDWQIQMDADRWR